MCIDEKIGKINTPSLPIPSVVLKIKLSLPSIALGKFLGGNLKKNRLGNNTAIGMIILIK